MPVSHTALLRDLGSLIRAVSKLPQCSQEFSYFKMERVDVGGGQVFRIAHQRFLRHLFLLPFEIRLQDSGAQPMPGDHCAVDWEQVREAKWISTADSRKETPNPKP